MKKTSVMFILGSVIIFCAVSTSMAQQLGLMGVGGRVSFVKPEDVDATVGFGGHVDFGEILPNLVLYPSLEFFQSSVGEGGFEQDFSVFSFNADVRYYFPGSGNARIFAGGGLGMHVTNQDVPDFGFGGGGDESQTDVGLNILGGVDIPVSENLIATGKGKFILSDQNGFKVSGGITYLIGK